MPEYLDTGELAYSFQEGKPRAFSAVYDLYFERLCVFAVKLVDSEPEAEDIVIQAFTKLFERHDRFTALPAIRAFLYVTVRNACFDYLKAAKVLATRQKEFQARVAQDYNLETAQLDGEVIKALYDSLDKLPDACRRVIEKLYIEGFKYKEVAEKLDISVETVKSYRKYALDKLRKALSEKHLTVLWLICMGLRAGK